MDLTDTEMLQSVSGFQFSGKPIDQLSGGNDYTCAGVLVDTSGSVYGFKAELEKMIQAAVGACAKSPFSEAMLVRVAGFNDASYEIHGFIGVNDIDQNRYVGILTCDGSTALYDAALENVETIKAYAEKLASNDYNVNGIGFVITDGQENSSRIGNPAKIKDALEQVKKDEKLKQLKMILVGIGTGNDAYFQRLAKDCGFDQCILMGDATPQKLARLGGFVSKSISSSSQALASGGVSQNITF